MTDANDILAGIVVDVLGQSAFALAEPANQAGDGAGALGVSIAFDGAIAGVIELTCDRELAREITANMLGASEDSITDDQSQDALNELLNVICGHYLSHAAGTHAEVHMGLPVTDPPGVPGAGGDDARRWFDVDDYEAALAIALRPGDA